MRYMLAMLLALGIGTAMVVPAAHASDAADPACYVNGVAYSCVQSSPVNLDTGNLGSLAGTPATTPVFTGHEGSNR